MGVTFLNLLNYFHAYFRLKVSTFLHIYAFLCDIKIFTKTFCVAPKSTIEKPELKYKIMQK